MRIALLAPLWKTVPPKKYGGSELVVANLAKGLVERGHEVTTFACGGSEVAGKLVAVTSKPMYDLVGGFDWRGIQQYEFLSFFELGKRIGDFDVVHNHMGFHPIALAPLIHIPFVTTLHSSMPPEFPYLAEAFSKYPFISISDAQRSLAPELSYAATIYHGIDVSSFKPRLRGKGKGFVFMGTLSKNKGIDIAVDTARRLGVPLTIAGEVREGDRVFLEQKVFPYVDGKSIRFVGEADHKKKARLFADADALLFPSRWKEAFGLVMVEALACGTPVVALDNGAVPEILREGVTGFIAKDKTAFIRAAKNVTAVSRTACRLEAENRFNIGTMAREHEKLYESLQKKSVAADFSFRHFHLK